MEPDLIYAQACQNAKYLSRTKSLSGGLTFRVTTKSGQSSPACARKAPSVLTRERSEEGEHDLADGLVEAGADPQFSFCCRHRIKVWLHSLE